MKKKFMEKVKQGIFASIGAFLFVVLIEAFLWALIGKRSFLKYLAGLVANCNPSISLFAGSCIQEEAFVLVAILVASFIIGFGIPYRVKS